MHYLNGLVQTLTNAINPPPAAPATGLWGLVTITSSILDKGLQVINPFVILGGHIIGPFLNRKFGMELLDHEHAYKMHRLVSTALYGTAGVSASALAGSAAWVTAKSWLYGNIKAQKLGGIITRLNPGQFGNARFKDIIGHNSVKEEFRKFILLAKELHETGRGDKMAVLLEGPSGTGKTQMTKAFVNNLDRLLGKGSVSMLNVNCSRLNPDSVEHLLHLINTVPQDVVVVFMDELQSLGSQEKLGSGTKEGKTLDGLLKVLEGVEGFKKGKVVIPVAATNYYHNLDANLQTRLQTRCYMGKPNREELWQMLELYRKRYHLEPTAELDQGKILDALDDFAGREVENAIKGLHRTLKVKRLEHGVLDVERRPSRPKADDGILGWLFPRQAAPPPPEAPEPMGFTQEQLLQAIYSAATGNKQEALKAKGLLTAPPSLPPAIKDEKPVSQPPKPVQPIPDNSPPQPVVVEKPVIPAITVSRPTQPSPAPAGIAPPNLPETKPSESTPFKREPVKTIQPRPNPPAITRTKPDKNPFDSLLSKFPPIVQLFPQLLQLS
jgi:hypothetical protein